tara:strand:- start:462 stop:761 length:300 start_codon:yes stop_codon:yes gene_type:complete
MATCNECGETLKPETKVCPRCVERNKSLRHVAQKGINIWMNSTDEGKRKIEKSCFSKEGHPTRNSALKAKRKAERNFPGHRCTYYGCDICGKFHLTTCD